MTENQRQQPQSRGSDPFSKLLRFTLGLSLIMVLLWLAISFYFSNLVAQPNWRRPDATTHQQAIAALRTKASGVAFAVTTADGLTLHGLHLPAKAANDRFVVLLHGYGGNLLEYQEQYSFWRDLGFDVFLYDQRGTGSSDGDILSAGLLESADVSAVMAFARQSLPAGALAGLYGRSGGGATAVMYAGRGGDADFVVVDCAYSDFPKQLLDRLKADHSWLPATFHRSLLATTLKLVHTRFAVDLTQAVPLRYASAMRKPVLFITTATDTYVSPQMTTELHAAVTAPKQLRVFETGGHGAAMHDHPDAYRAEVTQFLHRFIEPEPVK